MIAHLGLGSNLGDRLGRLTAVVELLDAHPEIRVLARSSVYETEPVGQLTAQPDFYNAVVKIETTLEPHDLLAACKQIERDLGREVAGAASLRHGPRPIDVDLLLAEGTSISDERLVLPHPELHRRRFVLVPLLEVEPELELADGSSLSKALERLSGQRVERVGQLQGAPS